MALLYILTKLLVVRIPFNQVLYDITAFVYHLSIKF